MRETKVRICFFGIAKFRKNAFKPCCRVHGLRLVSSANGVFETARSTRRLRGKWHKPATNNVCAGGGISAGVANDEGSAQTERRFRTCGGAVLSHSPVPAILWRS